MKVEIHLKITTLAVHEKNHQVSARPFDFVVSFQTVLFQNQFYASTKLQGLVISQSVSGPESLNYFILLLYKRTNLAINS